MKAINVELKGVSEKLLDLSVRYEPLLSSIHKAKRCLDKRTFAFYGPEYHKTLFTDIQLIIFFSSYLKMATEIKSYIEPFSAIKIEFEKKYIQLHRAFNCLMNLCKPAENTISDLGEYIEINIISAIESFNDFAQEGPILQEIFTLNLDCKREKNTTVHKLAIQTIGSIKKAYSDRIFPPSPERIKALNDLEMFIKNNDDYALILAHFQNVISDQKELIQINGNRNSILVLKAEHFFQLAKLFIARIQLKHEIRFIKSLENEIDPITKSSREKVFTSQAEFYGQDICFPVVRKGESQLFNYANQVLKSIITYCQNDFISIRLYRFVEFHSEFKKQKMVSDKHIIYMFNALLEMENGFFKSKECSIVPIQLMHFIEQAKCIMEINTLYNDLNNPAYYNPNVSPIVMNFASGFKHVFLEQVFLHLDINAIFYLSLTCKDLNLTVNKSFMMQNVNVFFRRSNEVISEKMVFKRGNSANNLVERISKHYDVPKDTYRFLCHGKQLHNTPEEKLYQKGIVNNDCNSILLIGKLR